MAWLELFIWPGTILLAVLIPCQTLIRRLDKRLAERDASRLKTEELNREEQSLALRDQATAAAIAEATVTEEAERLRAALRLQAAQDDLAAQIARHPDVLKARVDAELAIIAAENAADVQAVAADGANASDARWWLSGTLQPGFNAYLERGGDNSLTDWLGEADLGDLGRRAVRSLIAVYVQSLDKMCDDDDGPTLDEWLGETDLARFQ